MSAPSPTAPKIGKLCVCPCRTCLANTLEGICRFCWRWHQEKIQSEVAKVYERARR